MKRFERSNRLDTAPYKNYLDLYHNMFWFVGPMSSTNIVVYYFYLDGRKCIYSKLRKIGQRRGKLCQRRRGKPNTLVTVSEAINVFAVC